jgi:hypothetical protein
LSALNLEGVKNIMAETNDNVAARLASLEDAVRKILAIVEQGRQPGPTAQGAISAADWQSLGTKLDRFEETLEPIEKAVLMTVLGAAAATYERAGLREAPATSAPSTVKINGALDRVKLSDGLRSIGTFQTGGIGGFGDNSPVADSIGVGGDFTCVHGDWTKDLKIGDAMIRGRWNALNPGTMNPGTMNPGTVGGFGRSGQSGGGFR